MSLLSELSQTKSISSAMLSHREIYGKSDDNKRSLVGQMVVNNGGRIASLNPKFISIWNLTEWVVTARCERQVFQFITKQLENPQKFLNNLQKVREQKELEVESQIVLRNGNNFSYLMKPQWFETRVIGRIYQFRPVLWL